VLQFEVEQNNPPYSGLATFNLVLAQGKGPSKLGAVSPYTLMFDIQSTIAGQCPGIFEAAIHPYPSLLETGEPLNLTVNTYSGMSYQWRKGDSNILGATGATYQIDTVTEEDSGNYSCLIYDTSNAIHETQPAHIVVYPAGSVPAAGFIGLALSIGSCNAVGLKRLRRK